MQFIKQLTALAITVVFLSSCSESGPPVAVADGVPSQEETQAASLAKPTVTLGGNMTYAIQNSEGKHLGFLLMAGDAKTGDCIFRSLPAESELFDTEETKRLCEMQLLGEFSYAVVGDSVTFKHPQYLRDVSMTDGVLKAGDIEFRMERAKTS